MPNKERQEMLTLYSKLKILGKSIKDLADVIN